MIATIAAYFTKTALLGIFGKLWRAFCDFISTPVGAAIVAALIAYHVGKIAEYRKLNAAWETKWHNAEVEAEKQRLARDALIKAKVQADAEARLKELSDSKAALEERLKQYESEDAKAPTAGTDSVTDSRDDGWLRDAKRSYTKSKAGR